MNDLAPKNLVLIGCGKMGAAMLRAWQNSDLHLQSTVIDPYADNADYKQISDAKNEISSADIIILAIKPQIMGEICKDLAPHLSENTVLLSIAAGTEVGSLQKPFSQLQPIIRAMPNTPAAIGKGITVAVANEHVSDNQKALAEALLRCTGQFEWIADEGLMNAVTALSGSGPAYIFYLIETLAKTGEEIGLPPALAETLARQTVIGSAALAEAEAATDASSLRESVTSPSGTTEAALEVLMDGALEEVYRKALKAAVKRGKTLNL